MNSPGRKCVHATPDSSTASSTRRHHPRPARSTIRSTSASFAMPATSRAVSGSGARYIRSTPPSAAGTVWGRPMYPSTTSTSAGSAAFSGSLVSARTPVAPIASSRSTTSRPTFPVAPVTRMVNGLPLVAAGRFSGPHVHVLSHPGGVSRMSWLALGPTPAAPCPAHLTPSSVPSRIGSGPPRLHPTPGSSSGQRVRVKRSCRSSRSACGMFTSKGCMFISNWRLLLPCLHHGLIVSPNEVRIVPD